MTPEQAFQELLVLGESWPVQELDCSEPEGERGIRVQESKVLWAGDSCPHWSGPRSRTTIPAVSTLVMAICTAKLATAQTPGESLGNSAALEARGRQQEELPYTVKMGDFKLLVAPSFDAAWNDNINLAHDHALDDYIVTPGVRLAASYPFTHRNLLQFNVEIGYDKYLQHDRYSGVRLFSGSELSLDVYIKDFWINVHDRFQYIRDTAGQPDVTGSGLYGGLNNAVGVSGTWDLEDVVLTLGYDHLNFVSASSEFAYTDSATELVSTRAGCHLNPALTAGAEGSVAFTRYDQQVLNNSVGYNAGLYADWRPGTYLEVKPRGGYSFYNFSQTSQVIPAMDQDTWYLDLEVTHSVTDAFRYSLSAGHELRLGVEADTVEAWYVRPRIDWAFINGWSLGAYFSYENGKQGQSDFLGVSTEHYDWANVGLGLSHNLTSKLALRLDYRLTVRSSDFTLREYTQNLIGLGLTYQL